MDNYYLGRLAELRAQWWIFGLGMRKCWFLLLLLLLWQWWRVDYMNGWLVTKCCDIVWHAIPPIVCSNARLIYPPCYSYSKRDKEPKASDKTTEHIKDEKANT